MHYLNLQALQAHCLPRETVQTLPRSDVEDSRNFASKYDNINAHTAVFCLNAGTSLRTCVSRLPVVCVCVCV